MFESAEVGNKVEKRDYNAAVPKVRAALLQTQRDLAQSPLSVVIVVGGVEGAGKSETVNLLHEWMDARGIQTHALAAPSDEERERPAMWRFWRLLPPKGRIGIFFGSWYTDPIINRVFHRESAARYDLALERIADFERMLVQENTVVVKLWMHLSKDAQRKRLKSLQADPKQRWRVTKKDWEYFEKYDRFRRVSEHALQRTSTAEAPWLIVEASDPRYRALTVTRLLQEAIQQRLEAIQSTPKQKIVPDRPKPKPVNVLRQLDLTSKVKDSTYDKKLIKYEAELSELSRRLHNEKRSAILVFEGPDAAGKGGAIRRLTGAMDARLYQVTSVAAPTDEERAHPYLWRFWRHLPRQGRVTIYDRSWYGRVLVERIEGFCAPDAWGRAYSEINAFEEQLTDFGVILVKFWLAISPEEQLRRFKDREATPYKQYKITEEDWRNREKWNSYEAAACDMIEKTSAENSPWVVVPAEDKNTARLTVMKTVCKAIDKGLR
jgi:polyphosphate:AMP phosphotransferase